MNKKRKESGEMVEENCSKKQEVAQSCNKETSKDVIKDHRICPNGKKETSSKNQGKTEFVCPICSEDNSILFGKTKCCSQLLCLKCLLEFSSSSIALNYKVDNINFDNIDKWEMVMDTSHKCPFCNSTKNWISLSGKEFQSLKEEEYRTFYLGLVNNLGLSNKKDGFVNESIKKEHQFQCTFCRKTFIEDEKEIKQENIDQFFKHVFCCPLRTHKCLYGSDGVKYKLGCGALLHINHKVDDGSPLEQKDEILLKTLNNLYKEHQRTCTASIFCWSCNATHGGVNGTSHYDPTYFLQVKDFTTHIELHKKYSSLNQKLQIDMIKLIQYASTVNEHAFVTPQIVNNLETITHSLQKINTLLDVKCTDYSLFHYLNSSQLGYKSFKKSMKKLTSASSGSKGFYTFGSVELSSDKWMFKILFDETFGKSTFDKVIKYPIFCFYHDEKEEFEIIYENNNLTKLSKNKEHSWIISKKKTCSCKRNHTPTIVILESPIDPNIQMRTLTNEESEKWKPQNILDNEHSLKIPFSLDIICIVMIEDSKY